MKITKLVVLVYNQNGLYWIQNEVIEKSIFFYLGRNIINLIRPLKKLNSTESFMEMLTQISEYVHFWHNNVQMTRENKIRLKSLFK